MHLSKIIKGVNLWAVLNWSAKTKLQKNLWAHAVCLIEWSDVSLLTELTITATDQTQ